MLIIHRKSIMMMRRPQTPQPGFGSITLLQKFTPHFKILDPRLIQLCQTLQHIAKVFAPFPFSHVIFTCCYFVFFHCEKVNAEV